MCLKLIPDCCCYFFEQRIFGNNRLLKRIWSFGIRNIYRDHLVGMHIYQCLLFAVIPLNTTESTMGVLFNPKCAIPCMLDK